MDGRQVRKEKERLERKETRITRDIKTFIGWEFIDQVADLSANRSLVICLFLTGGRATEILDLEWFLSCTTSNILLSGSKKSATIPPHSILDGEAPNSMKLRARNLCNKNIYM